MTMNSDQIRAILPHRYPFLLVDRVLKCDAGKSAQGLKCVSANEPHFVGHFPEEHVMPGVLLIEAMAQVGAITILSLEKYKGKTAYFASVKSARFKRKVIPGDVLIIDTEITAMRGNIGIGKGVVTVDGQIAATAELTFAIGE